MSKMYGDLRQSAMQDATKYLADHVMVEEPVRSFRFHMHYTDKKYNIGRVDHRPGFASFTPVQSAKFAYNSTYAYTLTWTPGHMTIVGDLGQLVVVHYNAMPTLEEACAWLQSSDYDYLLSKTNEKKLYDQSSTLASLRQMLNEEVIDAFMGQRHWRMELGDRRRNGERHELQAWRKQRPPEGGLNEEEETLDLWLENKPSCVFVDEEHEAWRMWRKLQEELGRSYLGNFLTAAGRRDLLDEAHGSLEQQNDAIDLFRAIGLDDYYGDYEYRSQAFFQIAAIQHGCRLIQSKLFQRRDAA